MLGPQIMRLLREKWKSATGLAEELYAILQDDIPWTHSGPVTLSQKEDSSRSPLTIRSFGDQPAISFVDAKTGAQIGTVKIIGGTLVFDGTAQKTAEKCKSSS